MHNLRSIRIKKISEVGEIQFIAQSQPIAVCTACKLGWFLYLQMAGKGD